MSFIKLSKFKNYISAGVLSLCGYLYNIHLYFYNKETPEIFSAPGADETVEAYAHTFNYFIVLTFYFIVIILLVLFFIAEFFLTKKFNINIFQKLHINMTISKIYNILFWIGIILVLKTLIPTVLFLIFAMISNTINF